MDPKTEMRAHVIISKAMVKKIDRLVGQRKRSKFISDAVAHALAHLELLEAAEAAMGSGAGELRPWGDTPESIAKWVHDDRQASLAHDDELDALRKRLSNPTS
ncbi:MAG: hypothetical protein IT332_09570 [Ardenticatenales bacterium]|nr:hypothetical protein [Ardenticatenales bacterium]